MRVIFAGIGRLKAGSERALFDRYVERIGKAGRALGVTGVDEIEIVESRAPAPDQRKAEEAASLLAALPRGVLLIALDESGKAPTSSTFARSFETWKDTGAPAVAFALGGPDGHGPALIAAARAVLALGPMTWPHQIARVLIAEQVYRAITILSGHPYHRN